MQVPALKQVAYDPARFIDIQNVDEAVDIILCPTEGMTAKQRWAEEAPALIQLMEPYIQPGDNVLDYGCGIGRLAKPLIEKHRCKVVGVDISPNMRALAASLVASPSFFALDPAMLFVLPPSRFEVAISVWTLQHIVEVEETLTRLAVSLRPGGRLFIVNNVTRCVPVEGGEWADDGLDIDALIRARNSFELIERGLLPEAVAPGWMQEGTFWAAYQRR
jgi:SAM-dependent methyltransferase